MSENIDVIPELNGTSSDQNLKKVQVIFTQSIHFIDSFV